MSRKPLLNEPPLLDADRALRLAEEASALARDGRYRAELAEAVVEDAVMLALDTAIDTGDPRVLAAALDRAEAIAWDREPPEQVFARAAGFLLPHATKVTNRVRECARSGSALVRAETAKALGPRALRAYRGEGDDVDAEAGRIVMELTKDEDAAVRAAAREALSGAAPPAWAAFFDRDPLATRPAAEAARLRAPLDRAALALEEGVERDLAPLAEAIAALPDELAGPVLDAWIGKPYATAAEGAAPLVARWAALDTDGARIEAFVRRADEVTMDRGAGTRIGDALREHPHAQAVCMRVARWLGTVEYTAEVVRAVHFAEAIVERAWPDDADPTPLLEIALGAPLEKAREAPRDSGHNVPRFKLLSVALAPRTTFARIVEPVVDAFLAGLPGHWAATPHAFTERLLDVAHPRLRAEAEARLREGRKVEWALRYLTQGGHDPEHDPPPSTLLAQAAVDPLLRPAIIADPKLYEQAAETVRPQLAAGLLPPKEALALASKLVDLEDASSLSPEEWAVVRRARDALDDPERLSWAADTLPPADAWTPEDRAFIERLIEMHDREDRVVLRLALALQKRGPSPDAAAYCERLVPIAGEDAGFVRNALAVCRGERPNSFRRRK